ncbi:hypothetical protein EIK77_002374 [Talaromyces pinophilus]|nr:hypothetical protein EIK77_002374 [Talaromyces pinophilus]
MSNPDPQDLLKEIAELSGDLDTPLIGRDVPPPDAPPAMRKDMHTNNVIPQLGVNEMEPLGYLCLHGLDPNPAEVSQITAEFDEGQKLEEGPTAHIQGGQACYQVLQSGIWDPDIPDPVSGSPRYAKYMLSPVRSRVLSKESSVPDG